MYQNGVRVRGFERKRIHKQKTKKQFLTRVCMRLKFNSYDDYLARFRYRGECSPADLPDPRYWKKKFSTSIRQLSKKQTSRRIRREFRDAIQKEAYDTTPACHGAEYQKYFPDWGRLS